MPRTYGKRLSRGSARSEPPSPRSEGTATDAPSEATVVAAVPVLRLSAEALRVAMYIETVAEDALRVLSEASLAEDDGDFYGNAKSQLDTLAWRMKKWQR